MIKMAFIFYLEVISMTHTVSILIELDIMRSEDTMTQRPVHTFLRNLKIITLKNNKTNLMITMMNYVVLMIQMEKMMKMKMMKTMRTYRTNIIFLKML